MHHTLLAIRPEIVSALRDHRPIVALESTLIAHGLPRPTNLETARAAEAAVRQAGAVPATIAVVQGTPVIGLTETEIESFARQSDIMKASRRDLAAAMAQKLTAATTVAATMALAHMAGIRVFATGGIGGVHRDTSDVSADLIELSRTPVAVVCAGAKSILDIRRTLEMLETLGVPVVGYETDDFPAFYLRSSGEPVSTRSDSADQIAVLLHAHWRLGGAGVVVSQPVVGSLAMNPGQWDLALGQAEAMAASRGIKGKALTPFLLARLAEITNGQTVRINQALVTANAGLAGKVAKAVAKVDAMQPDYFSFPVNA